MITDYASLQQAIADWLARADLSAQIPTFIQLAETRLNRDLRLASMQATVYGTSDAPTNTITVPDDYRAAQSLRITAGGRMLEVHPLPPERLSDTLATAYPRGYVAVGNVLNLIGGNGAVDYTLTYYQKIPALSESADTNWLLLREPAAYLYASLIEASPYIGDDARGQVWGAQYSDITQALLAEDAGARYGNAPSIGSPVRNCP